MDEIVHVAASSRIPVLLATASPERLVNTRCMAIEDPWGAALVSRDWTPPGPQFSPFQQPSPSLYNPGANLPMSPVVIPRGNTPALTPQNDTEYELEEHGYAISSDFHQHLQYLPIILDARRSSPQPVSSSRVWVSLESVF